LATIANLLEDVRIVPKPATVVNTHSAQWTFANPDRPVLRDSRFVCTLARDVKATTENDGEHGDLEDSEPAAPADREVWLGAPVRIASAHGDPPDLIRPAGFCCPRAPERASPSGHDLEEAQWIYRFSRVVC
jgi:hypothetical protein